MRLRFGGVCGKCVVMLPCENELNRRGSRFGGNSKVYKCSLCRPEIQMWIFAL